MKTYILLAFLFFTSLKIQGMEIEKDQNIQLFNSAYVAVVQQLNTLSTDYMKTLEVKGRDYSKLVLPQITEVATLKYNTETTLQSYYRQSVKEVNDAYLNRGNVLAISNNTNISLTARSLRRTNLFEKAEREKAQEIELLENKYHEASNQISDFYAEPSGYLTTRNDTYVQLYFSLRDLRDEIESSLDQNNPQDIMTHFQKVKGCLTDFSDILADTRDDEDTQLAFRDSWITFTQTIDVIVGRHTFRYSMTPELITGKMIRDFKPLAEDLSRFEEILESSVQNKDSGMALSEDIM